MRKSKSTAQYLVLLFMLMANQIFFSQEVCHTTQFLDNEIVIKKNKCWFWEANSIQRTEIEQALKNENKFKSLPNFYPNFGFTKKDVWFRFILKNSEAKSSTIFFRVNNPNLDEIDLYKKNKIGHWKCIANIGDQRKLSKKKFPGRIFVVPLKIDKNSIDTFLLRVNNGGEQFQFIPSFVNSDYFSIQDGKNQLFFGIYFGIMLFIILFNLFSYFSLKEKTALWYSLYGIFLALLQFSLLGYGSYYLWPESIMANHSNPIFASASVLFLIYFCRDYLQTKIHLPKTHIFLNIVRVLVLLCLVCSLIPTKFTYRFSVLGINTITLVLNLSIIPIAILAIQKKYDQAKLFLIAFSVLIISVFGFILKNFGIIPSNFFTDYGLQIGSSLESILLSIGIVLKYKKTRETSLKSLQRLNEIREQTNRELEQKVKERTAEVESQKILLEIKNKEIISSISYAKRIQETILPSEMNIQKLLPKSVWWYMPKDIVAGDFYWINQAKFEKETWTLFAVADCTGHGVPGAMMSVMCVNALNTCLKGLQKADPGLLLEKVATSLSENLSSDDEQLADGMDISLVFLNEVRNTLIWSGANNPLWILRNSNIIEFKPTKRPVGKSDTKTSFKNNLIKLNPLDKLFLFTDGYADQFGGPKNKKFKRVNLLNLIEKNSDLALSDLLSKIQSAFFDWKKEEEQVDDISIFIIEI